MRSGRNHVAGYRIHFVSTGGGLPGNGKTKLSALCDRWATRGTTPLQYDFREIADLQVMYYNKTVPTLDKTVILKPSKEPYKLQLGSHRSFVFHSSASDMADLYEEHGEKILQQNIRTSEGDTETNLAIYRTAVGRDSENFYYFNNGVTILCDSCEFDPFQGSRRSLVHRLSMAGKRCVCLRKRSELGNSRRTHSSQ